MIKAILKQSIYFANLSENELENKMLPKRNVEEELKVKSETGNDTKKLRERLWSLIVVR